MKRDITIISTGSAIKRYPRPAFQLNYLYDEDRRIIRIPDSETLTTTFHHIRLAASASTFQQYQPYILNFIGICERFDRDQFSIQTLMDWVYSLTYPRLTYLATLANGGKPKPKRHEPGIGHSSAKVAVAAIGQYWSACGKQMPSNFAPWRKWVSGLYRRLRQDKDRKNAITPEDLESIISFIDTSHCDLTKARDKAIILMGFAAALRRSEISGLSHDALKIEGSRQYLHIQHSKTDQGAEGDQIPIYHTRNPLMDPIRAWNDWLKVSGIRSGNAFRGILKNGTLRAGPLTPQSVGIIIRQYVTKPNISAHSLRLGYVTQASRLGYAAWRIRLVSRHGSDKMVCDSTRVDDQHSDGPGSLL